MAICNKMVSQQRVASLYRDIAIWVNNNQDEYT